MCGEHVPAVPSRGRQQGSSPRVRGTLGASAEAVTLKGIIPACAGNINVVDIVAANERDHPRVCGEHITVYLPCPLDKGSSPRVRGTFAQGVGNVV